MPHSHVSVQHLAHGVLPSDKLILENQPHEAFAMAHVQAAYNAYCYSSQMQDRFAMAMDVARNAETDKRAAEGKADKLDNELRHEKAKIGNKAIQAFLDGSAGDEWLRKRTEDGFSIFQESFQKAKELTMAKYPSLFLDDVMVPSFESPSGETTAPTEAGDAISPGEKTGVYSTSLNLANECTYTVWPALVSGHGAPPLTTIIFMLKPGELASLLIPASWSSQLWARTLCSYGLTGRFNCLTDNCGTGSVECASAQTVSLVTTAAIDGTEAWTSHLVLGFSVYRCSSPAFPLGSIPRSLQSHILRLSSSR
ncbi:hypothetical protein RJ640_000004 [Escallonia rubra]|uniref:Uncharacterized protein n=1 Tax=Escallonia rubra TaxID=112253 RepID=A0AA88UP23_9ASTE|nr:hypothetical protein RJ640_000004 [Escallonia rubra]